MRLLDLADKAFRVYLSDTGENQRKLVIIYPRETYYTVRIYSVLREFLRPEEEAGQVEREAIHVSA
jgi:hypothetical protein